MMSLFPSALVRKTVGRRRTQAAEREAEAFSLCLSPGQIAERQLISFNNRWAAAQVLPFYAEWKRVHQLPEVLQSIDELEGWPVLTKLDLRSHQELVDATPGVVGSYFTSGSTSEPYAFPRGPGEVLRGYGTAWSYRMCHGLNPFEGFVAASNILSGAGTSRWVQGSRRAIRSAKDMLGNSRKLSGFIATTAEADAAVEIVLRRQPKYMIGYPSAIAAIARRVMQRRLSVSFLSHAILTSESVDPSDIRDVQDGLGVSVLIEYGANETGVVAGTSIGGEAWPLRVLWWSSLVRLNKNDECLITTLSPRVFPLFNYSLGDTVGADEVGPGGTVLSILDVRGRTRDLLEIATRSDVYRQVVARELVNLLRDVEGTTSVQLSQASDGVVDFLVVGDYADRAEALRRMSASIRRNHPEFGTGSVRVRFLSSHVAGARGKRMLVVPLDRVDASTEAYDLV